MIGMASELMDGLRGRSDGPTDHTPAARAVQGRDERCGGSAQRCSVGRIMRDARRRVRWGLAVSGLAAAAALGTVAEAAPVPPAGTLDLLTGADVAFGPLQSGALTGRSVAALGDVDGDGTPDL